MELSRSLSWNLAGHFHGSITTLSWSYYGSYRGDYHGTIMAFSWQTVILGSHKGCTWRPLDEHKGQDGQAGVLHVGLSMLAQVTCCNLQQHTQHSIISVMTLAPFVRAAPVAITGF